MIKLSIIVCTRDREEIIKSTLDYLSIKTSTLIEVELIVVDNHSMDGTADFVKNLVILNRRLTYILEPTQGLSYARNRGAEVAKGQWLFFLDDDAKLVDGSLKEVLKMIDRNEYDLLSGIWKAWYRTKPPKWLPESTGNYILKGPSNVREIGADYVSGGVMIVNRQKLLDVGGFPTNLGMSGNQVGYGEESWVENEFKKRGWKVGINPNIVIDHLVGEHKYKLSWHLKAAKAKGFADKAIHGNKPISKKLLLFIGSQVRAKVRSSWLLLTRKDYYIQNFVIDTLSPLMYLLGSLKSEK